MITPSFGLTATERVLPKLALDFTTASLDSRITFTRATGASNPATYVNSSGVITAATNNEPRFDYDPVTLACKGLLIEESRTNLLSYSANVGGTAWNLFNTGTASLPTVTLNYATAPDGTSTASRLQMTLNGGTGSTANYCTVAHSAVSMTSGASYAQSIYLKSNDGTTYTVLLRDDSGSGAYSKLLTVTPQWQRFDQNVVASATAGSAIRLWLRGGLGTSDTVDILAWGAQLEAGAFATSYIPTTTTALTRNADVATMTGTNFSSWWTATTGASTIWLTPRSTSTLAYLSFDDNTANNKIVLANSTTSGQSKITSGGTLQATLTAGTITANATNKVGCSWNTNNCAGTANATAPATTASATIPTVTQARIGSDGTAYANAWIQKIMYWPQRITNNEVQTFTK